MATDKAWASVVPHLSNQERQIWREDYECAKSGKKCPKNSSQQFQKRARARAHANDFANALLQGLSISVPAAVSPETGAISTNNKSTDVGAADDDEPPGLDFSDARKKQADEIVRLRNELREVKAELAEARKSQNQTEITDAPDQKCQALAEKVKELEIKLSEAAAEYSVLRVQSTVQNAKLAAKLDTTNTELAKVRAKVSKLKKSAQFKEKAHAAQIIEIETRIAEMTADMQAKAEATAKSTCETAEKVTTEIFEGQIAKQKSELEKSEAKVKSLESAAENDAAAIAAAVEKLEEEKAKNEALKAEYGDLLEEFESYQTQFMEFKDQVRRDQAKADEAAAAADDDSAEKEQDPAAISRHAAEVERELKAALALATKLDADFKNIGAKHTKLQLEKEQVERELSEARANCTSMASKSAQTGDSDSDSEEEIDFTPKFPDQSRLMEIEKLEREKDGLNEKIAALRKELIRANHLITGHLSKIDKLKVEIKKLESQLESILNTYIPKSEYEKFRVSSEMINEALKDAGFETINDLINAFIFARSQLFEMHQQHEASMKTQHDEMKSKYQDQISELEDRLDEEHKQQTFDMVTELNSSRDQIAALEEDIVAIRNQLAVFIPAFEKVESTTDIDEINRIVREFKKKVIDEPNLEFVANVLITHVDSLKFYNSIVKPSNFLIDIAKSMQDLHDKGEIPIIPSDGDDDAATNVEKRDYYKYDIIVAVTSYDLYNFHKTPKFPKFVYSAALILGEHHAAAMENLSTADFNSLPQKLSIGDDRDPNFKNSTDTVQDKLEAVVSKNAQIMGAGETPEDEKQFRDVEYHPQKIGEESAQEIEKEKESSKIMEVIIGAGNALSSAVFGGNAAVAVDVPMTAEEIAKNTPLNEDDEHAINADYSEDQMSKVGKLITATAIIIILMFCSFLVIYTIYCHKKTEYARHKALLEQESKQQEYIRMREAGVLHLSDKVTTVRSDED